MHACVIYTGLLCACVLPGLVQNEDHDGTGYVTMTAAALGEEETHSPHMPGSLRCDACRILATMLSERFDNEHNKMKSVIEKNGRLSESDVIDAIDTVCGDSFKKIGVKIINKKNRLSGPGSDIKDVTGVMQGGPIWPMRLRTMCGMYVGDIGEEELYQGYLDNKENFENFLCRGTGIQGDCVFDEKISNESDDDKKQEEKVNKEENEIKEKEKKKGKGIKIKMEL